MFRQAWVAQPCCRFLHPAVYTFMNVPVHHSFFQMIGKIQISPSGFAKPKELVYRGSVSFRDLIPIVLHLEFGVKTNRDGPQDIGLGGSGIVFGLGNSLGWFIGFFPLRQEGYIPTPIMLITFLALFILLYLLSNRYYTPHTPSFSLSPYCGNVSPDIRYPPASFLGIIWNRRVCLV